MEKLNLKMTIDRPIGYIDSFNNIYPINYGFVPGIIGGDGEEQDVYVISKKVNKPLKEFEGELIAIINRKDDVETKWVVSSVGEHYSAEEIMEEVHFIEQYFDLAVELIN
ncbi:inorganic diphosphatase [Vagococcus fluvialis]|uniref:inorganic diphosphatase n=1 Tax=Vagococcus fluvialis TaxID=2738 RepID=UPI003B216432